MKKTIHLYDENWNKSSFQYESRSELTSELEKKFITINTSASIGDEASICYKASGADTLIDKLANGSDKITLIFSHMEFPSHKLFIEMDNLLSEHGTNYVCKSMNHKLWLCPALNLYFPVSPIKLYVDYKASQSVSYL